MADRLVIDPHPAATTDIGRWLWLLQDNRRRTLEELDGIEPPALDWQGSPGRNSVGTLLYHIAAIEIDWLYAEVREEEFPPDIVALFPWEARDSSGRLTAVAGLTLDAHLKRLETSRGYLIETFEEMPASDFRRVRKLPEYEVTPEWVLYHLIEHEAGHRGEIGLVRCLAEQAPA